VSSGVPQGSALGPLAVLGGNLSDVRSTAKKCSWSAGSSWRKLEYRKKCSRSAIFALVLRPYLETYRVNYQIFADDCIM
jgi:hypothetical protein